MNKKQLIMSLILLSDVRAIASSRVSRTSELPIAKPEVRYSDTIPGTSRGIKQDSSWSKPSSYDPIRSSELTSLRSGELASQNTSQGNFNQLQEYNQREYNQYQAPNKISQQLSNNLSAAKSPTKQELVNEIYTNRLKSGVAVKDAQQMTITQDELTRAIQTFGSRSNNISPADQSVKSNQVAPAATITKEDLVKEIYSNRMKSGVNSKDAQKMVITQSEIDGAITTIKQKNDASLVPEPEMEQGVAEMPQSGGPLGMLSMIPGLNQLSKVPGLGQITNLIPGMGSGQTGMMDMLPKMATTLVPKLGDAIGGVSGMVTGVVDGATGIVGKGVGMVGNMGGMMIDSTAGMVNTGVDLVSNTAGATINAGFGVAGSAVTGTQRIAGEGLIAGTEITGSAAAGLVGMGMNTAAGVVGLGMDTVGGVIDVAANVVGTTKEIAKKEAKAIANQGKKIAKSASSAANKVKKKANGVKKKLKKLKFW